MPKPITVVKEYLSPMLHPQPSWTEGRRPGQFPGERGTNAAKMESQTVNAPFGTYWLVEDFLCDALSSRRAQAQRGDECASCHVGCQRPYGLNVRVPPKLLC